jgi:hypothetical protein
MTAAIRIVGEGEGELFEEDLVCAPPSWSGGAGRRATQDVRQEFHAMVEDSPDLGAGHFGDAALPGVMVPGVESDFVARSGAGADDFRQFFANDRSGTQRAAKKDIPAIQARGTRAQHLPQEGRPQQAQEMPAHIVRADGKEERGAKVMSRQGCAESRHAQAGASVGIDIDPQSDRSHGVNSPD